MMQSYHWDDGKLLRMGDPEVLPEGANKTARVKISVERGDWDYEDLTGDEVIRLLRLKQDIAKRIAVKRGIYTPPAPLEPQGAAQARSGATKGGRDG